MRINIENKWCQIALNGVILLLIFCASCSVSPDRLSEMKHYQDELPENTLQVWSEFRHFKLEAQELKFSNVDELIQYLNALIKKPPAIAILEGKAIDEIPQKLQDYAHANNIRLFHVVFRNCIDPDDPRDGYVIEIHPNNTNENKGAL